MTDRHAKWVPVEPGHVIPARQPYRIEYEGPGRVAQEFVPNESRTVDERYGPWFVDSSWRPLLELPTEPTWGIVVLSGPSFEVGQWIKSLSIPGTICKRGAVDSHSRPLDFIPLTPEQVARLETAR